MYQFVKTKLVLIHEQKNINFLKYVKTIIKGKIQSYHIQSKSTIYIIIILKGLGHAILGNFSTDGMIIELTKISK